MEKEFILAKSLYHTSLISYKKLLKYEEFNLYVLVLEYSDFMPLKSFQQKNNDFFKFELNLKRFFRNLIEVLNYLHQNKIIHRDIKFSNILISQRGDGIKLLDFGVAKKVCDTDFCLSPQGDFKYRAPEVSFDGGYDEMCDIWSCGLVLYSLVFGKNFTTKKMLANNLHNDEAIEGISQNFIELIMKMNNKCPQERISACEILQSTFLA